MCLVSLTYVPVSTSLRRIKLVGFIYVPVRRRDGVTAWCRSLILVIKLDQFYLGTRQNVFRHPQWFSLVKVPARASLKHLKDAGLIQVLVVMSLQRVELVSFAQVLIGTSLQRLKLVGFIYVPMRRRKDVSNRSVSFTYQSRCHDDVSHGPRRLDLYET